VARVEKLGVAYQTTESELHQLMAQWAEMA
jgi:hypothetical protein